MGLDAFLYGRKSYPVTGARDKQEDGYPVSEIEIEFAYWRKNWVLENIIREIIGRDDDQPGAYKIGMLKSQIDQIIRRIDESDYSKNEGRYSKEADLNLFLKLQGWIAGAPRSEHRDIYYRSSW